MSTAKIPDRSDVKIPWGAWNGDRLHPIWFPRKWDIAVNHIQDAAGLNDKLILQAIRNTIGAPSLREIARGKKSVCLAIEDITRPAKLEKPIEFLLLELKSAGIASENIHFVISNGAHAPMHKAEIRKKAGSLVSENFVTRNHHAYENLADTGVLFGKTPVRINRQYGKADLKIAVGSIMPHNFAGFSSGAKLVIPGLAGMEVIERTHKYVMMGFRGGINNVESNKFRFEIEDAVKKIGLDFFVGIVTNSVRETAGVFAGHYIAAHRAGVEFARKVYKTEFEAGADVILLNAYPKDSELLQTDAALTPYKAAASELVHGKGTIIITSLCSNGYGYHSLLGAGMRLSGKPIRKGLLKGRDLVVFSPNINKAEFYTLYWNGYHLAGRWDDVLKLIEDKHGPRCRVAVYPTAPLQLPS
jgi:nickel-dependent lactate racemase